MTHTTQNRINPARLLVQQKPVQIESTGVAPAPCHGPVDVVGQGAIFFNRVDFPLSLIAIWERHISINEIRTSTRKLVFDIARIIEYPRANGFNVRTLSFDDIRRASGMGAYL